MDLEQLTLAANEFASGLPKQIAKQLGDVDVLVCETPEKATIELAELFPPEPGEAEPEAMDPIPADCKGVFVGEPMETEESDETEESELVTLPEGVIVLIACNIADVREATLVLMHEVGHALGMDEDEVRQLGLGVDPGGQHDGPGSADRA